MEVSLLTCDLGIVLEIAGGLSATALAFIVRHNKHSATLADKQFPASAYYVLTKGKWYSRQKLPAVLCAAFGTVVLVLSLGLTINKALNGEQSSKVCT